MQITLCFSSTECELVVRVEELEGKMVCTERTQEWTLNRLLQLEALAQYQPSYGATSGNVPLYIPQPSTHPPIRTTVCKDWIYNTPKHAPSSESFLPVDRHDLDTSDLAPGQQMSRSLRHLWRWTAPTLPCHSSCTCYCSITIIRNIDACITQCQGCPWREHKAEDEELCWNFMPKVGQRSNIWELHACT